MKKWIVIPLGVALAAVIGLAMWNSTAEAQSPAGVGSGKCGECHKSTYDNWRQTIHSRMLGKAPDAIIPAWDVSKTWVPREDILFTIGSKYRQGYVTKRFEVLNIYWDTVKNEWFGSPGGVLRDWKSQCADCHTTGFNPTLGTFGEIGITCESCHGPGADHALRGARMDKTKAVDSATCNRCHIRKVAGREPPLTDTNSWWPDAHAKDHRMQGNEWKMSAHARTKEGMRADSCMTCPAPADVRWPPTYGPKATYQTAKFSVECNVCHNVHRTGAPRTAQLRMSGSELCTQCHTTGSGAPRVAGAEPHHAQKELWEGVGGFGVSSPMPSPMSMVTCYECHMVETGSSGGRWRNIASHNLKVIEPAKAARGEPDSCTGCHSSQAAEALQRVIDSRQGTVEALVTSLKARMAVVKPTLGRWDSGKGTTNAQKAFDEALTNVAFVESDKSKGFHNYPFAMALLKAADQRLGPTPPAAAAPVAGAPAPAGLPRTGDPWLPSVIGLTVLAAMGVLGTGLVLRKRRV